MGAEPVRRQGEPRGDRLRQAAQHRGSYLRSRGADVRRGDHPRYIAISPATINKETSSLKKLTNIFTKTNINLGIYTLVTIFLFEDISFTEVVRHLLKNVQTVFPINTNANIYCSLALNIVITIKAYTSIKHNGSKNHQTHPKYEPATSDFNSAFAAYIEYL